VRRGSVAVVSRLLLLPLALGACATTSTIENRSGGVVEAHILGGSPGSVYLANKEHGRFTMRRDDIEDVDLPGNMMALAGVGLLGAGGWWLHVGDTSCATLGEAGTCLLNTAPLVVGFLAAVWGGYVYARAYRRLKDRSRPEPDMVMPRQPGDPLHLPGWRKPDPFADPR